MATEVSRDDIVAAAARIAPFVRRTPVIEVGDPFGGGYSLALKLEHLQVTGSFKPRGAFSLLTAIDVPSAGVVAASGGNYGIAVAYAAASLGLPATVFVPESSPTEKIGRIARDGIDVRIVPGYYDEALAASREFAAATGAAEAHAYDQLEVVAGQGTLGRELAEQASFEAVVLAVGGGGLIGGVAGWLRGDAEVIAVEPEQCPSFHAARRAGQPVEVEVGGVAASSLGARSIGEHPWAVNRFVDDSVLVTEEAILVAQRWLWSEVRVVVEPAAATALAALQTGAYEPSAGSRVVAVLSGGNVDPTTVV